MSIVLYDLAAADPALRFSPFCWRIRMALAHKGLDVECVPWRFTDKEAIAFSGQGLVPVIRDGDAVVHDSWAIALHLDSAYPDRPALMDGAQARAHAYFIKMWCERVVQLPILKLVMPDLLGLIAEKDKAYFRESREKRFGTTLEQFWADGEAGLAGLRAALAPLRATVEAQPYLGGAAPSFADYIVFGAFQWARVSSRRELLADDDPIVAWRQRLLDLHDGLAGRMPARAA